MQIKVKNECFYCCSTFLSDSRGFTNEYNLYPIMSVKHHLACRWYYLLLSIDSISGHLFTEGNNKYVSKKLYDSECHPVNKS